MGFFFTHDHIQKIINAALGLEPGKRQTRRIAKPGETYSVYLGYGFQEYVIPPDKPRHQGSQMIEVYTASNRLKWQVGKDYAVAPGRGKPGVWWNSIAPRPMTDLDPGWLYIEGIWIPLRIVITAIRREPLQDISEDDARVEGVSALKWDPTLASVTARMAYRDLWDSINTRPGTRWADGPDVWVIEFEVKK